MKLEAQIQCPSCKKKLTQLVADMRPGKSRICPSCQTTIKWTGDDGRKAQKALDDFEKSLKQLSKKLSFKFKI